MKRIRLTYITFVLALLVQLGLGGSSAYAQNVEQKNHMDMEEMSAPVDTFLLAAKSDSLLKLSQPKERFIPNSNRSVWLAMAFPGAGQIYNRKYWKLPIVYGGFVGCAYALNWNNKMYRDYSQAYLDIMDDDPNTKSYQDFLPLNSASPDKKNASRKSSASARMSTVASATSVSLHSSVCTSCLSSMPMWMPSFLTSTYPTTSACA